MNTVENIELVDTNEREGSLGWLPLRVLAWSLGATEFERKITQ